MRRKILFLCNTYYQMMVAIHMRYVIYGDDDIDLILTDNSKDADIVIDRLNELHVFNWVYLFRQRDLETSVRTISKLYRLVYPATFGESEELRNLFADKVYDELLFYNEGLLANYAYSILVKKNASLRVCRFEECLTSYNERYDMHYSPKKYAIKILRKVMKKPILGDSIQGFYCFFPKLYHGRLDVYGIPTIDSDCNVIRVMRELFPVGSDTYPEKYVFFATMQDNEYGRLEEFNLLNRVAAIVGRDNLIVKQHPRDNSKRIEDAGLHMTCNSSIPWEAELIWRDFSKHVFITTISGSVLSLNLLKDMGTKTFLLYPLVSYPVDNRIESFEEFREYYPEYADRISVVSSIEQLENILR